MNPTVIGKLYLLRIDTAISRHPVSSVHLEQFRGWDEAMNKRGGGSFKLVVGPLRKHVDDVIANQLREFLQLRGFADLAQFLEMNITYNEVDTFGQAWEGFNINNGTWMRVGTAFRHIKVGRTSRCPHGTVEGNHCLKCD